MRNTFACVGLIVLAGCFTMVLVPDNEIPWLQALPKMTSETLPTIVLDPGHGGNDEGASAHGVKEKDLTLDIALRAEQALKSYNFPTRLTRRDDSYVPLASRAGMANDTENSIFISIHFNAHRSSEVGGVETFFSSTKEPRGDDWSWMGFFNREPPEPVETGEELAGFIQASLVVRTDQRNRGIKSRELYVTRHVYRPAALVEVGFISNAIEATLLKNADYRQRLAGAIAEGVLTYYKTRPAPDAKPSRLAKSGVE